MEADYKLATCALCEHAFSERDQQRAGAIVDLDLEARAHRRCKQERYGEREHQSLLDFHISKHGENGENDAADEVLDYPGRPTLALLEVER